MTSYFGRTGLFKATVSHVVVVVVVSLVTMVMRLAVILNQVLVLSLFEFRGCMGSVR